MKTRKEKTELRLNGVRIAVVGCGQWGKNLVRNFAELRTLHTICDIDPKVLESLKSLYPSVITNTDFRLVLENDEINGVAIATPAALHYPMAKDALLAGKDVFVEKPFSLTIEEGRELVKLAEERGAILLVGHVLEYHPVVAKLTELIRSGQLGKLLYIYSTRLSLGRFRPKENVLWDLALHDISLALLLVGQMPEEISVQGSHCFDQATADVSFVTMGFKSGVRAYIFASWLYPYKERKLVVVGDRKMALFDDANPEGRLDLCSYEVERTGMRPVPHLNEAKVIEVSGEEPLKKECQDFLWCIATRQKPRADGQRGLQVLEILSCCHKSLEEQGKTIRPTDLG